MKEKILNCVKFCILCYLMLMGFFSTFAIVLSKTGLHTIWAAWISLVLSFVSTFGLLAWVEERK